MTITATRKTDPVRERGYWYVDIELSDSVTGKTRTKTYKQSTMTNQTLNAAINADIARLESNTTHGVTVPLDTPIDVTPDPPTPPPDPTPEEIAEAAWFDDYRQLQAMLQVTTDVPALLTAQAQTAIDNLRTSLAASWLNSYLGKIR